MGHVLLDTLSSLALGTTFSPDPSPTAGWPVSFAECPSFLSSLKAEALQGWGFAPLLFSTHPHFLGELIQLPSSDYNHMLLLLP